MFGTKYLSEDCVFDSFGLKEKTFNVIFSRNKYNDEMMKWYLS